MQAIVAPRLTRLVRNSQVKNAEQPAVYVIAQVGLTAPVARLVRDDVLHIYLSSFAVQAPLEGSVHPTVSLNNRAS